MAICKNGATGNFTGKIAQVIARKIGNKTILQSKPNYKNRKTSLLQHEQETALSVLGKSYTNYYPTIFDRLMKNNYRNEPPYNWFVRHNCALFKSDYALWCASIVVSNNRLPLTYFSVEYNYVNGGQIVLTHQGLIFNYVSPSVIGYLILWDEQFKRFYVKDFGNVWQEFSFTFERNEFELPEWRTYFFGFVFHDLNTGFSSQVSFSQWGAVTPPSSFEWLITGLRMQPKSTYNFIIEGIDFVSSGINDLQFVVDLPLFVITKNSNTSFSFVKTVNPYDCLLLGTVYLPPMYPQVSIPYMCQPSSSALVASLSIVKLFNDFYGYDNWLLREAVHFYIAGNMSNFVNCFAYCNGLYSQVMLDSKYIFNFDFRELWSPDSAPMEVIITVTYISGRSQLTSNSSIMLYP